MRRGAFLACLLVLAFPAGSLAAPGGDAIVEVTEFTVAGSAVSPSGSATATCPTGMRATGGGVEPQTPVPGSNWRLQVSAPVDETGLIANTETGDIPRGWLATVTHSFTHDEAFRVYAICSSDSDAVVQHEQEDSFAFQSAAPPCPLGTRAVGGGVGANTPVPDGEQRWQILESNPVDETGQTSNTQSGEVARAWLSSLSVQDPSPQDIIKFFSICSAGSDGVIQAETFTVSELSGGDSVSCPAGRRALSGGVGVDNLDATSDRILYSAPRDGSGAPPSADGAVATGWFGAQSNNNSPTPRSFEVMAICASAAVPGPGPGPGANPAPDATAPTFRLSGKSWQRAGAFIVVTVACPTEACTAIGTGSVNVPGTRAAKRFKLGRTSKAIAAGAGASLRLRIPRKARKPIRRALLKRSLVTKVKATVTIAAHDAAGNVARKKKTIRFVR